MSFAADLQRFEEKASFKAEQALRKVSLELFGRVIMRTPVKTGRLRGNWQATTDAPAANSISRLDNGSPANAKGIGASKAKNAMLDVVLGANSPNVFYLTNTLPYAAVIEYGDPHGSQQAPQGMVRISVAEFQDVVQQITRALR